MACFPHVSTSPGCRQITLSGDPSLEQPILWEIEDTDLLQVGYAGTLTFEVSTYSTAKSFAAKTLTAATLPMLLRACQPAIGSLLHPSSGLTSWDHLQRGTVTGKACAIAHACCCLFVAAPSAGEQGAACLQDMTVFLAKPCCSQLPDQLGSWFYLDTELNYQVSTGE